MSLTLGEVLADVEQTAEWRRSQARDADRIGKTEIATEYGIRAGDAQRWADLLRRSLEGLEERVAQEASRVMYPVAEDVLRAIRAEIGTEEEK